MEKIDDLDRKILSIVTKNARTPSKVIAEQCGVSRAAVHQRMQSMIASGVILGSGYNVNPKALGFNTCTYVGIRLEKNLIYRDVVRELEKIPEVVECHFITGSFGMLIKVYAFDNKHLMELLNERIQHIPGVTETETLISLEQSLNRQVNVEIKNK